MFRANMLNARLRQSLGPCACTEAVVTRPPGTVVGTASGYYYEIHGSDHLSIAIAGVIADTKGTFFMCLSGFRGAAERDLCAINGKNYRIVALRGSGSRIPGAYEIWSLEAD